MNPLDLGVIAIIVLSAVFAFARGFVREALSIIAWVGAAAATVYGFGPALERIDPLVKNPLLSQLIAGFGLFVGSLVVLTIVTSFIARAVRASSLSPIDRTLGFVFGLLRGAFIVCLAYLLLDISVQQSERPAWIQQAKSAEFLKRGADELRIFLPESLKLKTAAVDDAVKALSPAAEAQRAMRALVTPGVTKSEPAPAPSYRPAEKRDLDRLIGTQR
jgi:membrane protein required for colicin V production